MKKSYVNQDLIDSTDFECAKRIKELRDEYGMTMEKFGDLFGVNKSTVLRWERGGVEKPSMIKQIAVHFGVSKAWLAGFDVPKFDEKESHKNKREQINEKLKKATDEQLSKIETMIDLIMN